MNEIQYMHDSNGVPHPTTCAIFSGGKCDCRSAAEQQIAKQMIEGSVIVAESAD